MMHLITIELLMERYCGLKRIAGSWVDEVIRHQYGTDLENRAELLQERRFQETYRPKPLKSICEYSTDRAQIDINHNLRLQYTAGMSVIPVSRVTTLENILLFFPERSFKSLKKKVCYGKTKEK